MFRSTTIIMELALNLAKVIFMLKHSVKLCRYMLFGTASVVEWSEFLATDTEVSGSIPGATRFSE